MRRLSIVRIIENLFLALFHAWRRRRIEARSQHLGVYWGSSRKPPVVSGRSFALFHRSRFVWTLVQILFLGALAVWTLRNYVEVFKTL